MTVPSEFDHERELFADLFEVADSAALTGLSLDHDERYQSLDSQTRIEFAKAIALGEGMRDEMVTYGVPLPRAKKLVETFMRCPCERHGKDINDVIEFGMREQAARRSMIDRDALTESTYHRVRDAYGFTEEQMAEMGMSWADVLAMREARRGSPDGG